MLTTSERGNRRARRVFPHQFSWLLDNPLRRLLISPDRITQLLGLSETSRVLEVGPGSGFFSSALAMRVPRGELVLLDVQPQMLAKAKRKLDAKRLHNVLYIATDATAELPFPDGSFDAVLLACVLGEVSGHEACLRSLHRVLREGGVLCVHESLPDPDMFRFSTLKKLVHTAGFVLTRRYGAPWSYTAIFDQYGAGPRQVSPCSWPVRPAPSIERHKSKGISFKTC